MRSLRMLMALDFSRLRGVGEGQSEAQGEAAPGLERLQQEADRRRDAEPKALAVYQEYQRNMLAAEELRAALLKGAKEGEDTLALLLKAVRAISLMTGDPLFYEQIVRDIQ